VIITFPAMNRHGGGLIAKEGPAPVAEHLVAVEKACRRPASAAGHTVRHVLDGAGTNCTLLRVN